jgi:hypothetical protein
MQLAETPALAWPLCPVWSCVREEWNVHAWRDLFIQQVTSTGPLLAACALVAGVIILLLGWRLSRVVAVLDFGLFGAIVGMCPMAGTDAQWFSAAAGAVAFGILALWMNHYSELVACGLIAGAAAAVLSGIVAAPLAAVLLVVGVAFTCSVALTCIAHRQASAVMTAVQGGLLSAFGLAACLACSGGWWHEIRDVFAHYSFALALFLLAPIMVGVMFQLASIQHEEVIGH